MPASPEEFYSSLWDMATHSSWAWAQIPPPSSLLPSPWQGSLAVPEIRTGSCEVSSAKAKSINPLLITCLIGSVGLTKESFRPCGLCPTAAWRQGESLPNESCAGLASSLADVGGKGSELAFLIGCILQVYLQHSYSLSCWLRE